MKNQLLNAIKVSAFAIVLSMGMSYAFAWTAPTATPPGGNVSAPINTGSASAAQTILGKLTVSATTTALDLVAQRDLFAGTVTTNQVNAATTTVTKAFVFPDATKMSTAANYQVINVPVTATPTLNTYAITYTGKVLIVYSANIFQGGNAVLGWNFLLNGSVVNGITGGVDYQAGLSPVWYQSYNSTGTSFTVGMKVWTSAFMSPGQIIIYKF